MSETRARPGWAAEFGRRIDRVRILLRWSLGIAVMVMIAVGYLLGTNHVPLLAAVLAVFPFGGLIAMNIGVVWVLGAVPVEERHRQRVGGLVKVGFSIAIAVGGLLFIFSRDESTRFTALSVALYCIAAELMLTFLTRLVEMFRLWDRASELAVRR